MMRRVGIGRLRTSRSLAKGNRRHDQHQAEAASFAGEKCTASSLSHAVDPRRRGRLKNAPSPGESQAYISMEFR